MNNSSGHIFYVKALGIANALRTVKDRIPGHNQDCRGMQVGPDDGKIRMVLSSPEVSVEIRRKFQVRDFRARLAFPEGETSFLEGVPYFEVYDVAGQLLADPIAVPELEDALANAVQVELFHFLLKTKGIDIPML